MHRSLFQIADINPAAALPEEVGLGDYVSFIPMADVTDGGHWVGSQKRPLSELLNGLTPFKDGDVLFAKITPCMENGKGCHAIGLENGVGFGSTEFHVLRPNLGVEPRYIYHLCNRKKLRLDAERWMIGSAGQRRVQNNFFREYEVFAPVWDEQKTISNILDTIDTQIQEVEALIAKLEQIKEGLLTDLLTRGIGEDGELRPSPEEAPHLYQGSSLGVIPKDWGQVTASEILDVKGGKRLPEGHEYVRKKTAFKYLRVVDFFEREYTLDSLNSLSEATFNVLSRYEILPGDLYISIAGSLGHVGVHCPVDVANGRTILTENAARLVLSTNDLPSFIALAMNSEPVQQQIAAEKGTGGGVPKLALFRIEQLKIPLPCRAEQERILSKIKVIDGRLRDERRTLRKLELQRIGLMDDLLTGRTRVRAVLNAPRGHATG